MTLVEFDFAAANFSFLFYMRDTDTKISERLICILFCVMLRLHVDF